MFTERISSGAEASGASDSVQQLSLDGGCGGPRVFTYDLLCEPGYRLLNDQRQWTPENSSCLRHFRVDHNLQVHATVFSPQTRSCRFCSELRMDFLFFS